MNCNKYFLKIEWKAFNETITVAKQNRIKSVKVTVNKRSLDKNGQLL